MVWTVCDSSPLETMSAAGHCNIETTESHWYIQYVWFGAGHMIIETMRQTKMSTRWHFSNYQVVEYFNISGCIITRFWPYRTTLLSINCTEELQYYTFSWLFALLWSSILICQVFAGWFLKKKTSCTAQFSSVILVFYPLFDSSNAAHSFVKITHAYTTFILA